MNIRLFGMALCLAASLTFQVKAQVVFFGNSQVKNDTIGEVQLLVQYEVSIVTDTLQKENVVHETMMLEVGKGVSKFYSYTKFLCDSVVGAAYANNASQEVINGHLKKYGVSKLSESFFKGYPAGKITTLNEVGGISKIRCEETEERPQWSLSEDTLNIIGYTCRRATSTFKGRTWTVWFATDIPVSEGPWKLYGLPGLVLKAEDSFGNYLFQCTGMQQCRTYRPILFHGKEYEPMNRKAYNKTQERYYDDPVGFLTGSMPNLTVKVMDEHGNKAKNPRKVSYSPLELTEK